jgi:hypothetical protein
MDLVFVGKPAGENSTIALGALEAFAAEIETEVGVPAKIVEKE